MTLLGDLCHRTVVLCLSVCLSVTLVYSGQTVGWIKMSLGTEVGLGSDDIMLDGDPASPIERGTVAPTFQSTALARSPISATAEFFCLRCWFNGSRDIVKLHSGFGALLT